MQGRDLTTKQKADFLRKLKLTNGNVSKAAAAASISRSAAYEHRSNNADFRQAWDDVIDQVVDEVEQELFRRGVKGWNEPVFYKGQKVGSIRKFSDSDLHLLAKAHRPEKYRERFDVNNHIDGHLDVNIAAKIDEVYGEDGNENAQEQRTDEVGP
jgi:hypothetical protein